MLHWSSTVLLLQNLLAGLKDLIILAVVINCYLTYKMVCIECLGTKGVQEIAVLKWFKVSHLVKK